MFCTTDGHRMDLIPSKTQAEAKTEAYSCPKCHGVQIFAPDPAGKRHIFLFIDGLEAAGVYPSLFQHSLF